MSVSACSDGNKSMQQEKLKNLILECNVCFQIFATFSLLIRLILCPEEPLGM